MRNHLLIGCLIESLLCVLPSAGTAEDYQPGKSYFGRNKYIEYVAGDLPLIFSAPHGGRAKPDEMPDRDMGTFSFDVNTQELARTVAEELHDRTGKWPHLIICRVTRRKLDCNREIKEATEGNPVAEQAWREFQAYIEAARAGVVKKYGRGFYIDLHGHGHPEQRLELGYLHSVEQLAASDEELNQPLYAGESSLKAIAAKGTTPYAELIRGKHSFGALMEARGFLCSPSPSNPHPKAPFFRGGYNTDRHARDAAPMAGLQIESYSKGIRDTPEARQKFAEALAGTLDEYLTRYMDLPISGVKASNAGKTTNNAK